MRVGDADNAASEILRTGQHLLFAIEMLSGTLAVERHFAAEKSIGSEPPQDQVGVGYSWLLTPPIANRSGICTRRLRTDG